MRSPHRRVEMIPGVSNGSIGNGRRIEPVIFAIPGDYFDQSLTVLTVVGFTGPRKLVFPLRGVGHFDPKLFFAYFLGVAFQNLGENLQYNIKMGLGSRLIWKFSENMVLRGTPKCGENN